MVSNRINVNNTKLFATDINDSALIVTRHITIDSIIQSSIFFIIAIILTYLICKYTLISCIDCKRTFNNEWQEARRKSTIDGTESWLLVKCRNIIADCCFQCWKRWKQFYKNNLKSDSPLAVIRTQIKQIIEIVLQS